MSNFEEKLNFILNPPPKLPPYAPADWNTPLFSYQFVNDNDKLFNEICGPDGVFYDKISSQVKAWIAQHNFDKDEVITEFARRYWVDHGFVIPNA